MAAALQETEQSVARAHHDPADHEPGELSDEALRRPRDDGEADAVSDLSALPRRPSRPPLGEAPADVAYLPWAQCPRTPLALPGPCA